MHLVDRNVPPSPIEDGIINVCRNVSTRGIASGPFAFVFNFFRFFGTDEGVDVVVDELDSGRS